MMAEKTPEDALTEKMKADILLDLRDRLEGLDERLTAYLDAFTPEAGEEPQEGLTPRDEGFWEGRLLTVTQVQQGDLILGADKRAYRIDYRTYGMGGGEGPLHALSEHGYAVTIGMVPQPWHLVWRKPFVPEPVPEPKKTSKRVVAVEIEEEVD